MEESKILSKFNIILNDINLLKTALTHSSYSYENDTESYERLEYLGDAVLQIVCSEYLYLNTNYPEGKMSKLRSLYVCENALYEYSKEIELEKYIKIGNGIKKPNKTIIADVFEAVVAVLYLEYGLEKVKELFNKLVVPYIERKEDFLMDYKSLLQERVQEMYKVVDYVVVDEYGPAHEKTFVVDVMISNEVYGRGIGSTKKEAEQNAAKEAYEMKEF